MRVRHPALKGRPEDADTLNMETPDEPTPTTDRSASTYADANALLQDPTHILRPSRVSLATANAAVPAEPRLEIAFDETTGSYQLKVSEL